MKLFATFVAFTQAKSLTKSQFGNLPTFDPESNTYSMQTQALLNMLGIDIETDAYFDTNGEVPLETLRSENGKIDLRGLKQLKLLVASQMSDELRERAGTTGTGFGLYCYYGCHCLTDTDHIDEEKGLVGGQTIDDIDSTCKQMGVCYRCLREKYRGDDGVTTCNPEETKYRFSFFDDGSIDCSANRDPCKRDTCLCDKDFAETVKEHEDQWTPENHIVRGGFDRINTCQTSPARSGAPFETCCGMDNFPYVSYKKQNQDQCCVDNVATNSYPNAYDRTGG